jgi:chromosomal replication initiator protein
LLAGVAWALQPPDEATRLKILKSKASAARLSVPEAILKMVASKLHGNVRELEGAINSLAHYSRLEQRPVDMPLAREALGELLRHSVRTISLGDIDRAVCVVLKLSAGKLQSGARAWAISHPRMIASYLCRKHTAATYGEIAKHFGSRTHSTAVAAEKKVRGWLEKKQSLPMGDREWNVPELIEKIERELLR